MKPRFALILFITAILIGTFLRAQDLLEPYEDRDRGASAALFALMAKNHLRYGLGATGGVGVVNPDRCAEEFFSYYSQHPQGCVLLATFGAMMGGTQSGLRLAFLPFAIGIVFLVYRLARRRGRACAATAGAIAALTPLGVYYGAFVSFEIPTLFFLLLAVQLLLRYGRRRRKKDLVRGVLAFGAAAFCDWIALALLPALVVILPLLGEYRGRRPAPWKATGLYALAGGLALGATVLQFKLQSARYGSPIEFMWSSVRYVTPRADDFTWSDWATRIGEHATTLVGWPLLLLAAVGLARSLPSIARRRLDSTEAAALAMLLIGLANIILLGNHARWHDYSLLHLLPAIALFGAGAFPFERIRAGTLAARALSLGVLALLVWQLFQSVELLERRRGFTLNEKGRQIREVTNDGEIVILVEDQFTLQVTVASDRYLDYARDVAQLEIAKKRARSLGKQGHPIVVLVPKQGDGAGRPEFLAALEAMGTRDNRGPYDAFQLGELE